MNDAEIERIVEELRAFVGHSYTHLWQPRRDRIVLGVASHLLLIVPRGPFARLHEAPDRPANPSKPFSFQGACRAHLHGPLLGIDRIATDRVVRITFARGALEIRLTGRSGGLWLLDGERVLAAHDGPAPAALPPLPVRGPHGPQPPRFTPADGESWNSAAARYFTEAERALDQQQKRTGARVRLERAIGRNERLLAHLTEDLGKADEAPAVRHRADLLAANLYRVARSQRQLVVEDWETGETVALELDPSKAPSAQLERLYHQAKRLEKMADQVLLRMEQVERELQWMRAAWTTLDAADAGALDALTHRLPALPERQRDPDQAAVGHVTWLGPGGQRVLIGRNARGNRRLTFQVARGRDWWMHIRGRPGGHVVIPMSADKTPPLDLLLAAAQIALLAARVGPGEAAEVQYTRVRDVRSVPGEEGLVTVHGERVLRVTRDPAALAGWATVDVS